MAEPKLIVTRRNDGNTRIAKVYYDEGVEEYVVQFYHRGIHQVDADYFDDDKESAIGTAAHYCRQEG